jgi:hypothetical protein
MLNNPSSSAFLNAPAHRISHHILRDLPYIPFQSLSASIDHRQAQLPQRARGYRVLTIGSQVARVQAMKALSTLCLIALTLRELGYRTGYGPSGTFGWHEHEPIHKQSKDRTEKDESERQPVAEALMSAVSKHDHEAAKDH